MASDYITPIAMAMSAIIGSVLTYAGINRTVAAKFAEVDVKKEDSSIAADEATWQRVLALQEIHHKEIQELQRRLEASDKMAKIREKEHEEWTDEVEKLAEVREKAYKQQIKEIGEFHVKETGVLLARIKEMEKVVKRLQIDLKAAHDKMEKDTIEKAALKERITALVEKNKALEGIL